MEPIVIIPAYQPGKALLEVVNNLITISSTQKIIIINDGSSWNSKSIFNQISTPNVTILEHSVNMGKGQALKTAFNYILVSGINCRTVITADADGQHAPKDIYKVINAAKNNPSCLLLGVRKFDGYVPFRSRFGNSVTRLVFKFFTGKSVSDTQTGLRGIPITFLPNLLKISSQGYEFELEMLIEAANSKITIQEIPINTIYDDNNSSSHFNPLLDSIKIYFVFIRFSAISILSAGVDLVTFALCYPLLQSVPIAIVFSRVVSGSFNFFAGKKIVFKAKGGLTKELVGYIVLAIFLMIISIELIEFFTFILGLNIYISKIISEGILFLASFSIQRTFIFRNKE